MRKSTQRNLFLLFIALVTSALLWVVAQFPPDARPTLIALCIGGVFFIAVARWIGGRIDAAREYRLRQAEQEAKQGRVAPPIRLPSEQRYQPSGDFSVRQVVEHRQHRQRIV